MPGILYFLFVLSGAAGLFYESISARYLGLFVGHDAYARLKLGNVAGTRRAFDELGRISQRPSSDLRTRLLAAAVHASERGGSGDP